MSLIHSNPSSNLFFWETISWTQSFKEYLGIAPSPSASLIKKMDVGGECLSLDTFIDVIAYLADHPHAKLEEMVKTKFAQIPCRDGQVFSLQFITKFSVSNDRLKMLDVCQRILSLDQLKKILGKEDLDIAALAKREARIVPKPQRNIEKISGSLSQYWQQHSYIFGKIIHCFHFIVIGSLASILRMFTTPLKSPPSVFEMKNYFEVYHGLIKSTSYLSTSYLKFFSSTQKAAGVGVLIAASTIGLHFTHQKFRLGIPEKIDKKEQFEDLTIEVQNGKIQKMIGRQEEKETLQTGWTVPPGQKFRIGFLIGEPGCGKTEFVKGLAWESVHDPNSFVYKKKIYMINTIQAVNEGTYYMDQVLNNLAGHEDDVVLFFDEGHSAGGQQGKIAPLMEFLKTKILAKNIRCLFATTEKEYADNIEHNAAFVDRCEEIRFGNMHDLDATEILKKIVQLDVERIVEVDPNAYPEILFVSKVHPKYKSRQTPRKAIDLYKDLRSYVFCWTPKKLKSALAALTKKRDNLLARSLAANNDPDWSSSTEGIEAFDQLQEWDDEIEKLTETVRFQTLAHKKIARLRILEPQYRKRYYEVLHTIADPKDSSSNKKTAENTHKEFLYLKHILRPSLKQNLLDEADTFKLNFDEEIPLQIDAALIKNIHGSLYPASPFLRGADMVGC